MSTLRRLYRHGPPGLTTGNLNRHLVKITQAPSKACCRVRAQRAVAQRLHAKGIESSRTSSGSEGNCTDCYAAFDPTKATINPQLHRTRVRVATHAYVRSESIPNATPARTFAKVDLSVPAADKLHTMLASKARGAFALLQKRPYICQSCLRRARLAPLAQGRMPLVRTNQTATHHPPNDDAPFRKVLKDAAKQKKKDDRVSSKSSKKLSRAQNPRLEKWELTVGIEIHAELNTARKLFSGSATSANATPNTHVALFDTAFPGTQPHFQQETLLPALRAALALNCEVQHRSSFDRKHYFYQDQPAGYQITQYYGKPPTTVSM